MAINGTTMRLTGMASGMDTDSLVKSMMQIEQLKVNRQLRTLSTMQWKQEQYNTVEADLKGFMTDFISVIGSKTMMKSGNYVTYNASVTGKNSESVTVTGTAEASAGSVTIDKITQLAEAAKAESLGKVSTGTELAVSNSTRLSELAFAQELEFEDGKIAFSINDVDFEFSASDSLQKMINTVNASDAGVTMQYSRLTDTISVSAKETGTAREVKTDTGTVTVGAVKIENLAGNAFGAGGAFGIDVGSYKNGKDAELSINGVAVERHSNSFTIDGISYTLNDVTDDADGAIKVRLTQDVTSAVDHIKEFVEGYNTLIGKLNDIVTSRKKNSERSYTPLTDEEKESMTEDQIEKWETIAKKGLLYNDAGIQGLLSGLRGALYEKVAGVGLSPAELGIRTGTYEKRGEIELDENILKSALEKNPQQVMEVFMSASSSADPATAYKENGLLHRINNLMNTYVKESGKTSVDLLETSIFRTTNKISDMEKRMLELEEKYYLKYAALEEAMSKMSSQTNSLTSLLGSVK